jgi:hypothetical protein
MARRQGVGSQETRIAQRLEWCIKDIWQTMQELCLYVQLLSGLRLGTTHEKGRIAAALV